MSIGPRTGADLEPFFPLCASGPINKILDILGTGNGGLFSSISGFGSDQISWPAHKGHFVLVVPHLSCEFEVLFLVVALKYSPEVRKK